MVEFMQQGTTIKSEVYCETHKKKKTVGPFRWNADIQCSVLHDNVRLHTAVCTRALLEHFNWELFDHPPYSASTIMRS
jgi:hypothetical protein